MFEILSVLLSNVIISLEQQAQGPVVQNLRRR